MKKQFIILPLVGLLFYFILCGYADGPGLYGINGTGSVTGSTGCSCHNATSTAAITVGVQLLDAGVPVTSYTGSHSYILRLTGTQTSSAFILPRFGFQLAAVKTGATTVNAGALAGTASGTHLITVGTVTLVEHYTSSMPATTGTGGAGTNYVVDIPWTSPVSGTGSVSVFAVLNAVNNNGIDDPADKWNNMSLVIPESTTVGPITGTFSICAGSTTTLSDATSGGSWTSGTTSVATIDATTGMVTGMGAGTTVITYTVGAGSATATLTVMPSPAVILGAATICDSTTATYTDATTGGVWSSSATSIATIGSASGIATALAIGTTTISYTLPASGCSASRTVAVLPHSSCALGTKAVFHSEGLFLTPNPNNGTFAIELVTPLQEQALITLPLSISRFLIM